jgi:hypothetical protein
MLCICRKLGIRIVKNDWLDCVFLRGSGDPFRLRTDRLDVIN